MKQPNTLPELLRHAADLAEKGESLAGKFEHHVGKGAWLIYEGNCCPDFSHNNWRIADQDQHLLADGWIRHTGDVCPVHPKSAGNVLLYSGFTLMDAEFLGGYEWQQNEAFSISHYKVTKAYVEPTAFEYKVGDRVFVLNKPYMSSPKTGTQYWYLHGGDLIFTDRWDSDGDLDLLTDHNCWKTEADAKTYAEAYLAHKNFLMGEIK